MTDPRQFLHCPNCGEPILPLIWQAGLTPKLAEALEVIRGYINEFGYAPSFSELEELLGLRSKSGVTRLLTELEQRGRINRLPGQARSISLVECAA